MSIMYVGMYEAREIPRGWQHPRDEHGVLVPLLPFGYAFDDEPGETMPPPLGDAEIAAYEICSEGTPVSPPFPNSPEGRLALVAWCAANERLFGKHLVDAEAWAAILFGNAAVTLDGTVINDG
jgi:hypothetical protein